jgi:hypothetical protein
MAKTPSTLKPQILALALTLALVACSDPHRDFGRAGQGPDSVVNAASPGATGAVTQEGGPQPSGLVEVEPSSEDSSLEPGALGAVCTAASDCGESQFCVDGVCCSSACTELCAACDLPGQRGVCSAAASDSACPPVTCSGESTDCRHVDVSQLALNCESFGKCRTTGECASAPEVAGTACATGAGTCDGNGACNVVGKASLGATCAMDGDCAEGHCVPGANGALTCCDTACDGVCQACAPSGHCEATPAADVRCLSVSCPADNVCRDYPAALDPGVCRSFGQCRTPQDCAGTQLLPAVECSCDANGACRLQPGTSCTDAAQCESGNCLATPSGAQVCCATTCGRGLFCSSAGSACVACEGAGIDCNGNAERRCNDGVSAVTNCPNGCTPGVGCNALPPIGFTCPGGQCAGTALCQADVNATARCCSRNCAAEGKVCAVDGSCACAAGQMAAGNACLRQAGEPCSAGNQCQAGLACADGVCCQQACNGACERCEAGTGACVAVAQGQQDDQCNGNRQCNGARGDCRTRLRQACTNDAADAECASGNCEPLVGNASAICCAQSCTGTRAFCKSDGTGCVQCETNTDCGNGCNTTTGQCNPLLDIGRNCGSSSQCASGASCLLDENGQTRCCERNCASNGQVCNASGRCVAPTVGAGQQCSVGAVNCSGNFQCINGICRLPTVGNGQACGAAANCDTTLGLQCIGGVCGCGARQFARGECKVANGFTCPPEGANGCATPICTDWFVDFDGDGFGRTDTRLSRCGDGSAANRPPDFVDNGPGTCINQGGGFSSLHYVTSGGDCCDLNVCNRLPGANEELSNQFFPGQTVAGRGNPACGASQFDRNCVGGATIVNLGDIPTFGGASCAGNTASCTGSGRTTPAPPACGDTIMVRFCGIFNGICTTPPAPPESIQVLCL